jgi:hypothetical protein
VESCSLIATAGNVTSIYSRKQHRTETDLDFMGDSNQSDDKPPVPAKRPYEKPSFRHEKVFETMALACGKIQVTQAQCRFNRKLS